MRTCVFCKRKDTKSGDVHFFKFPADKRILQFWIKNMSYEPNWVPSKNSHLCSQHFSSQCLDFRDQLFRLRKGSIPTIFDGNNENVHINYRQILDSYNLNLDSNFSRKRPKLQAIKNFVQVTNEVHFSKFIQCDQSMTIPKSSCEKPVNSLTMESTPNMKAIVPVASSHIVDHDHSYVATVEKMKSNLMIAKTRIHQLTAKNKILARKHKRSKKKIASMEKIIKHLSKKTL